MKNMVTTNQQPIRDIQETKKKKKHKHKTIENHQQTREETKRIRNRELQKH